MTTEQKNFIIESYNIHTPKLLISIRKHKRFKDITLAEEIIQETFYCFSEHIKGSDLYLKADPSDKIIFSTLIDFSKSVMGRYKKSIELSHSNLNIEDITDLIETDTEFNLKLRNLKEGLKVINPRYSKLLILYFSGKTKEELMNEFGIDNYKSFKQLLRRAKKSLIKTITTLAIIVIASVFINQNAEAIKQFIVGKIEEFYKGESKGFNLHTYPYMELETEMVVKSPKYVPKGFKVNNVFISPLTNIVGYSNGSCKSIDYSQKAMYGSSLGVNNYKVDEETVYIHKDVGTLYISQEEEDNLNLVWGDGRYTYTISGYLSKKDIIKMAESLEKIELIFKP